MAKVDQSSLRDWNNGEVMTEAEYEKALELLRVAINDNFDRLVKNFKVLNEDGSIAVTQSLNTAINFLQFKKSSNIDLVLDNTSGTLTIAVKQGEGSNLDADKLDGREATYFATKSEHDDVDTRLQTIEAIDLPGIVEDAEQAVDASQEAANVAAVATASVEFLKINKDFQMRPVTWKDLKDYGVTWGMLRSGMVKFYAFKFWRFE